MKATCTKILLIFSVLFSAFSYGQNFVTLTPEHPSIDDTLIIRFNAAEGNKGLMNHNGTVYMHSGLITGSSASPTDWRYQVGIWGSDDQPTMMTKTGKNVYEKKIVIKDYFSVPPTEEIKLIAFVFRDVSGNKVGKAKDDQDIFINVGIKPSVSEKNFLGNYSWHQFDNNTLLIKTDTAYLMIQAFANAMVKVSYFMDGKIVPDTSYSVIRDPQLLDAKIEVQNEYIDLTLPQLTVRVNKFPLRLSYIKNFEAPNNKNFLKDENGFYTCKDGKGFRFALADNEAIFGTGSRATALNKRGQKFSSYNTASYGYKIGAPVLNINIPFIVSSELYAIYFENHSPGYFDIGASEKSVLDYKIQQGNVSYYLMAGKSYDDLLEKYTWLTGRQPLPPLWAHGFIQSKYGYKSDKEALKIVEKLKKDHFPLDGLVLDLYWFGSPKTMGNLDWDREKFKNPEQLIKDLKSYGVHLINITEPYITKTSDSFTYLDRHKLLAKNKTGASYVIENFWAGPSALLDLYQPEAKEWMWKKYKTQINNGIDGWWCDLGEPENHPTDMMHSIGSASYVHNVYSQVWAQMLSEKYKSNFPNQRLFNLIRSGYAGMQRYSTFPWSGDIQRSYDGLKTQVQIMLSMGMSGVAYMHSDLGGFTGGPKNPELYTRWLQFGAFCPIMRAHGEGVPSEPVFYDKKYKNIVRDYINLRYQLLPYNYSLSYQNAISGTPMAKPLNYFEPANNTLSSVNDEYYWGPNLLVAPVFESGAKTRKVVFPKGQWINFWNDSIYNGNSSATIAAPLDKMPLFVKAGSFIPTTNLCSSTAKYHSDSLLVYVYPDKNFNSFEFTLFEDDGMTANTIENNAYESIHFSSSSKGDAELYLDVLKEKSGYIGAPKQRSITYAVKMQPSFARAIFLMNEEIPVVSAEAFKTCAFGSYYNQIEKTIYIRYNYASQDLSKVRIVFR